MEKLRPVKLRPVKLQPTTIHVHDIAKGSNLDLLIRGFHGIANKFAEEVGDGLHAIALALSTKEDNSAQILELASEVKTAREKLQTSLDKQTQGE